MSDTRELLLHLLALEAEGLAMTAHEASRSTVGIHKVRLEAACARVFASIDAVITLLELDHVAISEQAELKSQRLGVSALGPVKKAG